MKILSVLCKSILFLLPSTFFGWCYYEEPWVVPFLTNIITYYFYYPLALLAVMLGALFLLQVAYFKRKKQFNYTLSKIIRAITKGTIYFCIPIIVICSYVELIAFSYVENLDQYFSEPTMLIGEYSQRFVGFLFVSIIEIITLPGRMIVEGIMKNDGEFLGVNIKEHPKIAYAIYVTVEVFIYFFVKPYLKPFLGKMKEKKNGLIASVIHYVKQVQVIYSFKKIQHHE